VREGKNDSARCDIPVHSAISPLVKTLARIAEERRGDEFLIWGQKPSGMDQRRSYAISRRFAWFMDQLAKQPGAEWAAS
jgi:hypothetical protein